MKLRNKLLKCLTVLFFYSILHCCGNQENTEGIKIVTNIKSKYENTEFVTLEKLFTINLISDKYEISDVPAIDIDEWNNIYVLGFFECCVVVFDEKGNYLRTMGRQGQGPQDLVQPYLLNYFNNNLYIYQSGNGLKIWDVNGKYIKKINTPRGDYRFIKPLIDYFLVLLSRSGDERNIRRYFFNLVSKDFKDLSELLVYEKDDQSELFFSLEYAFATNNNVFYFPERSNKYSIVKYDLTGKKLMTFGREYNRKPFSETARSSFREKNSEFISSGLISDLSKYPPVINKIFLDSFDNIWIVSGEFAQKYYNLETDGTIDIFSEDGEWLYSFEMKEISYLSFIKNDRLYTVSTISEPGDQQYINVYKVHYNH